MRIEVEDDGPGVPEHDAERIFQFGYTTKAEGHGFGLHSAAVAAGELGGRLWLEPAEDGGARFVLTLPVDPEDGDG